MIIANIISFIVNLSSICAFFYLQKTKDIKLYTVFTLINSVMYFIKGLLFNDVAGSFSELFWISVSIYGLMKNK